MLIVMILVFIAAMCAAIYLIAIYALPILTGLAAFALLKQTGSSVPIIVIVSIATGCAALAAARAGASAHSYVIRIATLVLVATPAGYAGYSATLQLARVFGLPEEWWTVLPVFAAFAVAAFAIDTISRCRQSSDSAAATDSTYVQPDQPQAMPSKTAVAPFISTRGPR